MQIDPNLLDPICNTGLLDPTLFPVGSAQHLDINYNILPFLCDLLKAATDDTASPLLTNPPSAFDITPYTDFSMLTAVGDPRFSLGEVMTQTYINFLPRVITQTEVRQNGGTQVVDNYICNADGVPLKSSITGPILLSLDLTGQKSYKYGAITVPPISATYEQLMQPIHPDEVISFVRNYINGAKNESAQDFSIYIQDYFLKDGWVAAKDCISTYNKDTVLIVHLNKLTSTNETLSSVYIKYYGDVANSVGCFLSQSSVTRFFQNKYPSNMGLAAAMYSHIPNYTELLTNPVKGQEFKQKILNAYVSSPKHEYTYILSNSAMAINYFNTIANTLGQTVDVQTKTVQVSAISAVNCY